MTRFSRLTLSALAIGLLATLTTGCDLFGKAASLAGDVKNEIKGTVKNPDGSKGVANATVKVYKNSAIFSKVKPDGAVDFDALIATSALVEAKTGTDGSYSFKDLKLVDGPYVLVASNARGKDFRGINRETRKFFDVGAPKPGEKLPAVDTTSMVNIDVTAPLVLDFNLPEETPPAPPAPATPEAIPTPGPPPAAPKPADIIENQAKLPRPVQNTTKFDTFTAVKLDGTALAASGSASETGLVSYDMGAMTGETNKVLLKATGTAVTSAKLRISHIPASNPNAAIVTEQSVNFKDGKLSSDNAAGYVFAVPRDKGKTVVQLTDTTSGATSLAIAFDSGNATDVRPFTIIMTWDKGDGTDVDLHTFDIEKLEEAWFGDLGIAKGSLDLDNTKGYGPETYTGAKGRYGIAINYWYGTKPTVVKVRVITAVSDKTYTKTLGRVGEWWEVGEYKEND